MQWVNRRAAIGRLGLFAASIISVSAWAGEIVLYEHGRFRGRAETYFNQVQDLAQMRFANDVSSVIVRQGTWELCSEPGFRGECKVLEPGEYSQIDSLNDRVRSVRELSRRNPPPRPSEGYPSGVPSSRGITIYEHGGFGGRAVSLNGPVPNLGSLNMNNTVSSLIVRGGTWELCVQPNFGPPCRRYGTGDHSSVGDELNDRFSSARPVGDGNVSSYPPSSSKEDIVLFEQDNFAGRSRGLSGRVNSLDEVDFNDRAASIIVYRGSWQICTDANFRGDCQTLEPGRYGTLDYRMRRKISSARPERGSGDNSPGWGPASGWSGGGWSGSRGRVVLYEYGDFVGRSYTVSSTINSLADVGFNDKASSVVIESGTWEFCTDAFFNGTCRTVGPGRYGSLPREMDSKISSVRQVGR
jgi:Beta/Gamma crystallin